MEIFSWTLLWGTYLIYAQTLSIGLGAEVTLLMEPAVVTVGGSVVVTCTLTGSENDALNISPPHVNTDCTAGCYKAESPGCNYSPEQCTCDSVSSSDYCIGAMEVSYTVNNVHMGMSGEWRCRSFNTQVTGSFNLNVFTESDYPSLSGDFTNTHVGVTEIFTCTSANGSPPPKFQWTLTDESNNIDISANATSTDDQSSLHYVPQREHNQMKVVCTVTQEGSGNVRQVEESLTVKSGYVVDIQPCGNGYAVEVGTGFQMKCNILVHGYPVEETYSWVFKGESLPETGKFYNVSAADVSHAGVYSCAINNGVTAGQVISDIEVHVFYHPRSVSITGPSNVTEGANLSLVCDADAMPSNVSYEWTHGNTKISDMKELTIEEVTPDTAGNYTCRAKNKFTPCGKPAQEKEGSVSVIVTVLYSPKGKPQAKIENSNIVVETSHTLFCDITYLESIGVPEAEWLIWKKGGKQVHKYPISSGTDWQGFVSTNVTDTGQYTCIAENTIDESSPSNPITVNVEAPLSFEKFNASKINPVYNGNVSGNFNLTCVVSASKVDDLDIYHQSEVPSGNDFVRSENADYSCDNGCKYGVETGHLVTLEWRASDKQFQTCDEVTLYDGVYQCVAESTLFDFKYKNTSDSVLIETYYGAIWNGTRRNETAENDDIHVVLSCPVCANPPPTYQWYFNGTDSSSKIPGATSNSYSVPVANDSTFGLYFCETNNSVRRNIFPMALLEAGPAEEPTDLVVLTNLTTSSSLTVQWKEGRSGNVPPVYYFIKKGLDGEADCTDGSGFELAADEIVSLDGVEGRLLDALVETLEAESDYCIQIHGENSRPAGNTTNENVCACGYRTRALPNIKDVQIESVSSSHMTVAWKFTPTVYQNSNPYVGLAFEYGTVDASLTTRYPDNGSVDAQLQRYEIPGSFNDKSEYKLSVLVYEGHNTQETSKAGSDTHFYPDTVNIGGIVGGLIAIILVAVLVGAVILNRERLGLNDLIKREEEQTLNSETIDTIGDDNEGFVGEDFGMTGYADVGESSNKAGNLPDTDLSSYAQVDKTKKKNQIPPPTKAGAVYAEVNKNAKKNKKVPAQGAVYAEVDKNKKKNKKNGPQLQSPPEEVPYEDVQATQKPTVASKPKIGAKPVPPAKPVQTSDLQGHVSEDGCVYIQVEFPKYNPQTSHQVVHGKENMTVYAQIDWNRTPLPLDDLPPEYQDEDVMEALPPKRGEEDEA